MRIAIIVLAMTSSISALYAIEASESSRVFVSPALRLTSPFVCELVVNEAQASGGFFASPSKNRSAKGTTGATLAFGGAGKGKVGASALPVVATSCTAVSAGSFLLSLAYSLNCSTTLRIIALVLWAVSIAIEIGGIFGLLLNEGILEASTSVDDAPSVLMLSGSP